MTEIVEEGATTTAADDTPAERAEEFPYMDYLGPRMRALFPDEGIDAEPIGLRSDGDTPPTMFGYLALFGTPAKVDSAVEGQFIEKIAPSAFRKTIADNRRSLRVIYDHGKDARYGRRPIASLTDLREDQRGVYFEAEVIDNALNRDDLLPALRAGVLGSSFGFRPTKKPSVTYPTRSTKDNPDMWPEVTVTELAMREFGPTPFPVYDIPAVGIRSITDEYLIEQLAEDPERFRALLDRIGFALPKPEPAEATPEPEAAPAQPAVRSELPIPTQEEWNTWLRNISTSTN